MDRMVRSSKNLHKILEVFDDTEAEIKFLNIPFPVAAPAFRAIILPIFGMIAEIETRNLSQRVRHEKRQHRERKFAITPTTKGL